jgi:hypothetical protein
MKDVKNNLRRVLPQILLVVIGLCIPVLASSKKAPLPDEVTSAKSIYIDNKTGNQAVFEAASDEFNEWGRFKIIDAKDGADLVVVFTHTNAIGKWGNIGVTKMDVFPKGKTDPAFHTESNASLILQPQLKTLNCVANFRDRLEPKK